MLRVTIPEMEMYDSVLEEFFTLKEQTLQLEHSLISLSKWESKWQKPFLNKDKKSIEESMDYIRCMTINSNVDSEVYKRIPKEVINNINSYIDSPMTATVINTLNDTKNKEIITSEIIYYWMIALNIPFECQKWHLNRLLTLINVCNIKSRTGKKMSRKEVMNRNRDLNRARRNKFNTKG